MPWTATEMVSVGDSGVRSADDIRSRLRPVFERLGVEKAFLFGSFARGTQTRHSDVDLLVIHRTPKRYFDRYDDFRDVYDLLEGSDVELLIHTPGEFSQCKTRPFIQTILSEGIIIYGN